MARLVVCAAILALGVGGARVMKTDAAKALARHGKGNKKSKGVKGSASKQSKGGTGSEIEAKSMKLKNEDIICPVLAALHRHGSLKTDEDGNSEIKDVYVGLTEGMGVHPEVALFQAFGITGFPADQKNIEQVRDRCVTGFTETGSSCFLQRFTNNGQGGFPDVFNLQNKSENERFLNLFTMNGKQAVEHGISTGVRGGVTNMPMEILKECKGKFPCESLFKRFWMAQLEPGEDRFYTRHFMKTVCLARQIGDRGGENSYLSGYVELPLMPPGLKVVGAEWQMKGALTATLQAFGKADDNGEFYLTVADMRALFMEGRVPDGWAKRPNHGCLFKGCDSSVIDRLRTKVEECDVGEFSGFWQDTKCKTSTDEKCTADTDCKVAGSFCFDGTCTCRRGSDTMATCFSKGKCSPPGKKVFGGCMFNGKPCIATPTNNPVPRGMSTAAPKSVAN